jgi:hypothetical protein
MSNDDSIEYDNNEDLISFLLTDKPNAKKITITGEEINYFYDECQKLDDKSQKAMEYIKKYVTSSIMSLFENNKRTNNTPQPENIRSDISK